MEGVVRLRILTDLDEPIPFWYARLKSFSSEVGDVFGVIVEAHLLQNFEASRPLNWRGCGMANLYSRVNRVHLRQS